MTRTPEEIFEDILHVMTDGVDRLPDLDGDERHRFLTGKAQRRHALWDELAKVVTRDRDVPGWASLAVVLLRDQFAREAADAKRREIPESGHAYSCCGKVGRISRHESWCSMAQADFT